MIGTGRLDLTGNQRINRWTPWTLTILVRGLDLTGGTFKAQWRRVRDDAAAAVITLNNATAPDEGISVSVETVEGVPESTLELRIAEATIEGLPFTSPRGGDLELVWDLHVTATGIAKTRLLEGDSPIRAGSTQ